MNAFNNARACARVRVCVDDADGAVWVRATPETDTNSYNQFVLRLTVVDVSKNSLRPVSIGATAAVASPIRRGIRHH